MTTALIPVKRLEESKSRLFAHLPGRLRSRLTLAMLEDLLEALHGTRGIDRVAVTTPDEKVAHHAGRAGAEILMRPEPGLNEALEDGLDRLFPPSSSARPEGSLLFVLGDVAGALSEDFDRLIDAAHADARPGLWLAPSSDGGTSALLHRPPGIIPCCFGRESAKRHAEAAAEAKVPLHELKLDSLAIDLDHPEDLEAFLATPSGGRRTRELLGEISESTELPPHSESKDPA